MCLQCALDDMAKGYGSYLYYLLNKMFIYFSPVWKYCVVTWERINTSFCTERGVIGHLGARWEKRIKKCIWDFCLQWFQFYRDGFGWLAQGERSLGSGRSLKNKGRLTFVAKKRRRKEWERQCMRVFICLSGWKFTIVSHFAFISLFPPPSLIFPSHYTISRSSSSLQNSPWPTTLTDLHEHRYKHYP